MRAALALAVVLALPCPSLHATEQAQSTTVIGPSNAMLADGAVALEAGRVEEGIRKTLEGLKGPNTQRDIAAGYCNLCAGYGLLKRWDEALGHCNTSLGLDPSNWRTYNNRAAAYTGKGLYDLALTDIESALEIAPESRTLRKTLRIVEEHKRADRERSRSLVRS